MCSSDLTPLSALALCELADRAGIPAGVLNVVVGSDSSAIGKVLTQHPDVAKFTFTGSTAVGRVLMAQCATTVKKISLELGGNAPYIVFDDADIAEADRKSTRLNSSHKPISYAVFCLKKKIKIIKNNKK